MIDLSKADLNPDKIYYWLEAEFPNGEWYIWEPETIEKDLKKLHISPANWEKVMALRVVAATNRPWQEFEVFENVVLAFNDIPVDFGTMQVPSPQEIAYSITVLNKIKPNIEFSDEIKKWIAANCFANYGLVYLDPPLGIAQNYLDKLLEDFPQLQSLKDEVRTKRNTISPETNALKYQIGELNAIREYVRQKWQS